MPAKSSFFMFVDDERVMGAAAEDLSWQASDSDALESCNQAELVVLLGHWTFRMWGGMCSPAARKQVHERGS